MVHCVLLAKQSVVALTTGRGSSSGGSCLSGGSRLSGGMPSRTGPVSLEYL